jgi:hypothetical protein
MVKRGRGGPRPGSGRKPLPTGERLRNRVMFTLADAELKALERAADGEALSAFVRRVVLRYLTRRR